jgi:endoglucanase
MLQADPSVSRLLLAALVMGATLSGCVGSSQSVNTPSAPLQTVPLQTPAPSSSPLPLQSPDPNVLSLSNSEILQQSWSAYKQRFIQTDGRVIDWEGNARTVSEGTAYAMLRSVLMDDPDTFAQVLSWAEDNLQRRDGNTRTDQLWVWKWGQDDQGNWGVMDSNFASDADIDAITALILASRRWDRPEYLQLAQSKLKDLWELSTVEVMTASDKSRYLLPGPAAVFQPEPTTIYLNPSYLAPAAFRLFAQVDAERDWMSLVDSSYQVLSDASALSSVRLPGDWVGLNTVTGEWQPLMAANLTSVYSFDAYRVWWRVAWDAVWFDEPRAKEFLQGHLGHLQDLWRSQQSIPARIDLQGTAIVDYEATAQYVMLYPALQIVEPAIAEEIRQQKIFSTYRAGIWDNDAAYYVQNLAWLGLFPPQDVPANLLQPSGASP